MEVMKPDPTLNFRSVRENLDAWERYGVIFLLLPYSSRYDKFKEELQLKRIQAGIVNGAMMDIGIYTVYPLMVVLFGRPKKIDASGIVLSSGADGQGAVNFEYEGMNATALIPR